MSKLHYDHNLNTTTTNNVRHNKQHSPTLQSSVSNQTSKSFAECRLRPDLSRPPRRRETWQRTSHQDHFPQRMPSPLPVFITKISMCIWKQVAISMLNQSKCPENYYFKQILLEY